MVLWHVLCPPTVLRPAEVVLLTENTLVSAGNTILLTCIGYGNPLPSLSWERVGHDVLRNDRRTTIFESMTVRNGAKFARSILQICEVTDGEDTGVFSCTSGNVLYNHSATVELTVHGTLYNDVVAMCRFYKS